MFVKSILIIIFSTIFLFGSNDIENKKFNLNDWITFYYKNPQPDKFEVAVNILSNANALSRKNALAPLGSFFSVLFEENENNASQWVNHVKDLEEKERKVFIFALYYSDIENKFDYINKLVKSEKEKKLFENMKKLRFIKIIDMQVHSTITLDQHWGGFSASGDEKHIYQIIDTLSFGGIVDEKKAGKYRILEGAAKWSLTSNASQHKKVLDICKYIIDNPKMSTPEVQTILKVIVNNVEKKIKNI